MFDTITPLEQPWRILFMGTPEFAVPTLNALIHGADEVVAVVAQPDRPAGRGRRLRSPPTVLLARECGIPTLQPTKVRTRQFQADLASFVPDLIVVVAYGRILTPAVLGTPRYGCINVHASLLPQYRGAAPIQWAIVRGESITGVTTMQMDAGLDTGDILMKRIVPILAQTTAGDLHDTLAPVGAELLMETIKALKGGRLEPQPQRHDVATLAPIIQKGDGLIRWECSAGEIDCHVRGMSPWPSAFTFLNGRRLVVLEGTAEEGRSPESDGIANDGWISSSSKGDGAETRSVSMCSNHMKTHLSVSASPPARPPSPGEVIAVGSDGIWVATGSGRYRIELLKPQNGKPMSAAAFLNGRSMAPGDRLSTVSEAR